MRRKNQYRHNRALRADGVAILFVVLLLTLFGILLTAISHLFLDRTSSTNAEGVWLSDLLLNLGASFFSAIPTFILFELIVNRYKRQEQAKESRRHRMRENLVKELVDGSTSQDRKQQIIEVLKQEKLLQGYEVDLSGADLSHLDLSDVDFSSADLRGAKLVGVKAKRAVFGGTQLSSAILSEGDFSGCTFEAASMRRTDLQRSKLIGTEFRRAFIGNARFQGADLSEANLKGAKLGDVGVDEPACDQSTILPDHREWTPEIGGLYQYTR